MTRTHYVIQRYWPRIALMASGVAAYAVARSAGAHHPSRALLDAVGGTAVAWAAWVAIAVLPFSLMRRGVLPVWRPAFVVNNFDRVQSGLSLLATAAAVTLSVLLTLHDAHRAG